MDDLWIVPLSPRQQFTPPAEGATQHPPLRATRLIPDGGNDSGAAHGSGRGTVRVPCHLAGDGRLASCLIRGGCLTRAFIEEKPI